jgi:hypothetical protein
MARRVQQEPMCAGPQQRGGHIMCRQIVSRTYATHNWLWVETVALSSSLTFAAIFCGALRPLGGSYDRAICGIGAISWNDRRRSDWRTSVPITLCGRTSAQHTCRFTAKARTARGSHLTRAAGECNRTFGCYGLSPPARSTSGTGRSGPSLVRPSAAWDTCTGGRGRFLEDARGSLAFIARPPDLCPGRRKSGPGDCRWRAWCRYGACGVSPSLH